MGTPATSTRAFSRTIPRAGCRPAARATLLRVVRAGAAAAARGRGRARRRLATLLLLGPLGGAATRGASVGAASSHPRAVARAGAAARPRAAARAAAHACVLRHGGPRQRRRCKRCQEHPDAHRNLPRPLAGSQGAGECSARARRTIRSPTQLRVRRSRGRSQAFDAAHVRPQGLRQHDGAVLLLPVLQQRDHRASDREPAAVQRVREARLVLRPRPEPDLRPPGLVVRERRAGADLAVGLLPGQPYLDVVRLLRGEAEVAGAQRDHAVVEPQPAQRLLRVVDQLLEGLVSVLGGLEPDQLDLVELVLPDDPLGVLAGAARFAAEARREGAILERQRGEDLVAVVVGNRHLGGGDQVQAGGGLEQVLLELGQLAGAPHRVRVHQVGRQQLDVPALAVQIDEEAHQRPLETREVAPVEDEPRPRHLPRPGEVEEPQPLAQLVVLARGEGEPRLLAPRAHHHVVLRIAPHRDGLVREVGHREQGRLDLLLDLLEPRFLLLHLVGERLQLGAQARLLLAAQGPHLLAGPLLLRPPGLGRLDQRLALGGELLDGQKRRRCVRAARRKTPLRLVEVGHHPAQIEHPRISFRAADGATRSRVWRLLASIATAVHRAMPDDRTLSDAELLTAFRAGSSRAFEVLVRRYQAPVLAIARRFARDLDDAEDLAQRALREAIARLPRRQREVLLLRIDGDLPFAEIAATLGITEVNAKVNFHHAVQKLKTWVSRD